MSENKIGIALVHEICPICGKPMNEQILMNSVLSKKYAKEIENVHGKAIGYSKTACEDCSKYKDEAVMCIADEVEEQIQQLLQYDNYKDIYYVRNNNKFNFYLKTYSND